MTCDGSGAFHVSRFSSSHLFKLSETKSPVTCEAINQSKCLDNQVNIRSCQPSDAFSDGFRWGCSGLAVNFWESDGPHLCPRPGCVHTQHLKSCWCDSFDNLPIRSRLCASPPPPPPPPGGTARRYVQLLQMKTETSRQIVNMFYLQEKSLYTVYT